MTRTPVALLAIVAASAPACSVLVGFEGFDAKQGTSPDASAGADALSEGSPRVDAGAPAWRGDFETGDFSQYGPDLPSTRAGDPLPPFPEIVAGSVDPAHVRQGRFSARFSLASAQTLQELVPAASGDVVFREGDDRYFAFSMYLDPSWSANPAEFCTVAQWATELGTRAPLLLGAEDDGFKLSGGAGHPSGERYHTRKLGGGLVTGRWTDWVVHVKFSSDPTIGFYEVFLDGKPALEKYAPAGGTLYPGATGYLRVGLYSSAKNTGVRTVWHDGWRVGTSAAAIATP